MTDQDPTTPITSTVRTPPTTPAEPPIESLAFDAALAELQRTVAELEAGGQPLEVAIALYERGVALQARCDHLLREAELTIQQLVARAGGALEVRDVQPDDATAEADGG